MFTGGSLLVGSAARTDLVAPERTEELARAQYRSLQRLARLDDDVAVWPTHGAGSFCSAPPGAERTSTIGAERATNALLRAEYEDVFVKRLLDSLGSFPPYFLRLGEINRRGPALVEGTRCAPSRSREVARLRAVGCRGGGRAADRRLRRRPRARVGVHPAAAGVRDLAGLARRTGHAAGDRAQPRPGSRRRSSGRPARSATT